MSYLCCREQLGVVVNKRDFVIIGAGPGGISSAIHLLKMKKNVLVIDKATFPRKKLCGGLLTLPAIKEIQQLGVELDPHIFKPLYSIHLITPQHKLLIPLVNPFYLVDRYIFDNLLLNTYKSLGGQIIEGQRVTKIEGNLVYLADHTTIPFTHLIGADGALSVVKKYMNPHCNQVEGFCVGANFSQDAPQSIEEGINLFFGIARTGYGWVFNSGDSFYTVGIGGEKKEANFVEKYETLCSTYGIDGRCKKGAWIPYGTKVHLLSKGNIYLVGDAAGLVDPLIGEGIYPSLYSGRMLAESFAREGDTHKNYQSSLKTIMKNNQFAFRLRPFILSKAFVNFLLYLHKNHPQAVQYAFDKLILKKDLSYKQGFTLYKKYQKEKSMQ